MAKGDALIEIRELSFKPLGADRFVLRDISLDIKEGDFILLLGPSGSGKSMLTRCFNGLIPQIEEGEMQGSVRVMGKNTQEHLIHEFASAIGMIFQNPDDQILSLKVVDEVAWGVENQGLPHAEIVERVDEFLDVMEITKLKNKLTFAISGGQKQRVSIAANLAMLQEVLILDDPTTDLDPVGKSEVVRTLARLNRELGKTLVVIEHDLNDLIELSNRLIVINDSGGIQFDDHPGQILAEHYDSLLSLGVNMPQHTEIVRGCCLSSIAAGDFPVSREKAFDALKSHVEQYPELPPRPPRDKPSLPTPLIQIQDLEFAYDPKEPVLRGITLELFQGEFVAIVGANGSGKSTLVSNLIGLLKPDRGQIIIDGKNTRTTKVVDLTKNIGYVFQNPDHQLFTNTVSDEVGFSLRVQHLPENQAAKKVEEALKVVELDQFADRHPFSLSRGQRQKLAVATALVHEPRIILLDEPTTGQDRRTLAGLLDLMADLNRRGNTTIMVTHDMDIVAAYATRVVVMAHGKVVMDGPPDQIFYENFEELRVLELIPPSVIDFSRRLNSTGLPRFLLVEELLSYLDALNQNEKPLPSS